MTPQNADNDQMTRREIMARRRQERSRLPWRRPRVDESTLRRTELRARRRDAARRRLRRRTWLPVALIILAVVGVVGSALAWFTTAASIDASISTGTWDTQSIRLCPGTARALHADPTNPNCPHLRHIASVDAQGVMALDFGDQKAGAGTEYCDVFRITSLADQPLSLTFTLSGAAAALVGSVRMPDAMDGSLPPGETRSVAIQLDIAASVAPGRYEGALLVEVAGRDERYALPLLITVTDAVAAPLVRLRPGGAKAPHTDPSRPLHVGCRRIAAIDDAGNLSLDFGDQRAGTRADYRDVLRVKALTDKRLRLRFSMTGAATAFFPSIRLRPGGGLLAPHRTSLVRVGVVVPRTSPSGSRTGTLIVEIEGTTEKYEIPVVITIVAAKKVCRIAPGRARAPHEAASKAQEAKRAPIASFAEGALSLDFGDRRPGAHVTCRDVFRIRSLTARPLRVAFRVTGAGAGLISSVKLNAGRAILLGRHTARVRVVIAVPLNMAPGLYSAELSVIVGGGKQRYRLPVLIRVLDAATTPAAAPAAEPGPETTAPTSAPPSDPSPTAPDTPSPTSPAVSPEAPSPVAPSPEEPSPPSVPDPEPGSSTSPEPEPSASQSGARRSSLR